MIAAVILAGGQARRMGGQDKGLLPLKGRTVLDHVIERIAPQVQHLALNANGDADRFKSYGLPVIADTIPGYPGPLAGVLAGLDWAADQGIAKIVTVAADTPFFPMQLVTALRLGAESGRTPLAMAHTKGEGRLLRHPTFTLWDTHLREDLRQALMQGLHKIILWTEPHGCTPVVFEAKPHDPFFNINTPKDLSNAESLDWGAIA